MLSSNVLFCNPEHVATNPVKQDYSYSMHDTVSGVDVLQYQVMEGQIKVFHL